MMDKCGLSLAELRLLGSLVARHIESGSYWGRPDEFYKRQDRVADWIDAQIDLLVKGEAN